jgi:hypothetical protein
MLYSWAIRNWSHWDFYVSWNETIEWNLTINSELNNWLKVNYWAASLQVFNDWNWHIESSTWDTLWIHQNSSW